MESLTVEMSDVLAAEIDLYLEEHPEYSDRHALVREAINREIESR